VVPTGTRYVRQLWQYLHRANEPAAGAGDAVEVADGERVVKSV